MHNVVVLHFGALKFFQWFVKVKSGCLWRDVAVINSKKSAPWLSKVTRVVRIVANRLHAARKRLVNLRQIERDLFSYNIIKE